MPLTAATLLLLGSCTTPTLETFEVCELDVVLTPEEGAPGDVVVARGGPFSEERDTRVQVGGYEAEVVAVTAELLATGDTAAADVSEACELCQTCRVEAGCAACGSCTGELLEPARRDECFGDPLEGTIGICDLCQQQVSFVVPAVGSGATTVWMINGYGASAPIPFTVLGGPTTGATADTGTTETAETAETADTGTPQTGDTGGATAPTGDTAAGGSGALPPTGGTGGS